MKTFLSVLLLTVLLSACGRGEPEPSAHDEHGAAVAEIRKGSHGGRLLSDGDFTLELAIFETGVPPEYRAWLTQNGQPLNPAEVSLQVELHRLGGIIDRIGFAPAADYLRGDQEIVEPHSFAVKIRAAHAGAVHEWAYDSFEGRTTIAADIAKNAGIETAVAGPGEILETQTLYGAIAADATRVREVKARFPGLIKSVARRVGDRVEAGAVLARVESNDSLQTYAVTAPISGVITLRHAEPGEQAGEMALFEVADFSRVWAEFKVFPKDRARLRNGQSVRVTAEGGIEGTARLDYIAALGSRESQGITVRATLDNRDGRWLPGQFVEGRVTVAQTPVPLAVPLSALQPFRDFTVVFAQVGDTYEVRMLELGRRDSENVEVLGGLAAGTRYVTANSYLVKADIEKSGASHDH